MSKNKNKTDLFDFDLRYDQEKNKHESINTDCVLEKKEDLRQFYTGLYYQKCYHNTGRYKWINGDQKYVYEGKLYANDLHGYGRLVYPDNSTYEGLFFHNKRFGPGVVTYPEELQDVGLWDGKYLIRLSQYIDLADIYFETIPTVGKTIEGKLYLLKYKNIVPIIDANDPVAKLVKKLKMSADDSQLLYSKCVRNYKSIFMNRSKFDTNFYTDPKDLIVDVVDHFDENEEPVINKINATNLLAWNNEKIFVEIMKHSFVNRKYEKVISYKIRNAFLPNRRRTFMPEGPIEAMCLKLLIACRDDDTITISKLICDYDLYPTVSDCYGNTTVIYAALANKRNAIKTLVNLGANINALNDECISALCICILNYIAIKNNIIEEKWETSFLKTSNEPDMFVNGRMWPTGSNTSSSCDSESRYVSSSARSDGFSISKTDKKRKKTSKMQDNLFNKQYVFNLIFEESSKRASIIPLRKKTKSKIFRKTRKSDKTASLNDVLKTISTLIECGADVNACDVPFPPLISSLFCDNLKMVQIILDSNVDVNRSTRADSGCINPLHIVCAMEKSVNQEEMMNMLLDHGADVNVRSDISHWPEARDQILAGDELLKSNEPQLGKTPFHILAMRYNFQEDGENNTVNIAKLLVKYGADVNAKYLGHNIVSLACLRGNIGLVDYILSNYLCDPNGSLGYNMGVPLTMLTMRKYLKLLMPINKLQSLFDVLENYANPFNEVSNSDKNALEFAADNESQTSTSNENIGLKMLFNLAATVLRRYIDSRALQFIYNNPNLWNTSIIANIVKYLNLEKAKRILQILIDYNIVPSDFEPCKKLLNYIHAFTENCKMKINFTDKSEIGSIAYNKNQSFIKSKSKIFGTSKSFVQIIENDKIYEIDFDTDNRNKCANPYMDNIPEIDQNHEKYKVCFECLKRIDKKLQLCPYCNLVYFCSINCNRSKNKSGEHPCKIIFYNNSDVFISKLFRNTVKNAKRKIHTTTGDYDNDYGEYSRSLSLSDTYDSSDINNIYSDSSGANNDSSSINDSTDTYNTDVDSEPSSIKIQLIEEKKEKIIKVKKKRHISRKQVHYTKKWYIPSTTITKRKKKCNSSCKGTLIAIDFKETIKDVEMKMRQKFKPPEIKHLRREVWSSKLKCKLPLNEQNIDTMLRVAKRVNLQLIPVLDSEQIINPCDHFDYKFWQLFIPYCVFQNGDLFYRTNDCDLLYKLPYSYL